MIVYNENPVCSNDCCTGEDTVFVKTNIFGLYSVLRSLVKSYMLVMSMVINYDYINHTATN